MLAPPGMQAVRPEEYNAMLRASHQDEHMRPKPPPAFSLWPPEDPDAWWERYRDPQLYQNVPRDQIPPNMRPPIEVPQPPRGNLVAAVDPQQDWDHLMWLLQPPKEPAPWIEPPAIFQQQMMDPPLWTPPPPPPRERLIPPRDKW